MRLVSYRTEDDPRLKTGAMVNGDVVELAAAGVVEALVAHTDAGGLDLDGEAVPLSSAALQAPVPNPGKIICVGLNYRDHAAEAEMELPEVPLLFAKYSSSIVGPGATIELPALTSQLDFEAELAVVIGRGGRDVVREDALGLVGGYFNLNDISARDVQLGEGGQWTRGKSFDTFAPIGPFVATPDEIPDPQDLAIECLVNGETMQSATTMDMIFPVAELIAFISTATTLHPGDVIATGTPPGVGMGRRPPIYLSDGDEIVVEVAGLGRLQNRVSAAG